MFDLSELVENFGEIKLCRYRHNATVFNRISPMILLVQDYYKAHFRASVLEVYF